MKHFLILLISIGSYASPIDLDAGKTADFVGTIAVGGVLAITVSLAIIGYMAIMRFISHKK